MFQIGLSKKRVSALVLATMVFVTGCDRSATPTSDKLQASEHTVASHQRMAETLDLAAQQDFDDARRGLIAAASGDVVISAAGEKMWDASDYDFLQGDAPATVNPSLWRQAKLNNIRGLFQVEEGIYQLRGFDLANLTLIKGDSGWIVVDPLTTIETVTAAMAFAEQRWVRSLFRRLFSPTAMSITLAAYSESLPRPMLTLVSAGSLHMKGSCMKRFPKM